MFYVQHLLFRSHCNKALVLLVLCEQYSSHIVSTIPIIVIYALERRIYLYLSNCLIEMCEEHKEDVAVPVIIGVMLISGACKGACT
jgi:hypothetical protein